MEEYDITLITAARRRFDSWDRALTAAGLDYKQIVLRTPFKRRRTIAVNTRTPHREATTEQDTDSPSHVSAEHVERGAHSKR